MVLAGAVAGFIMSGLMAKATIENTASATALFMDSFLSPHLQGLVGSDILSPENAAALDRLLATDAFEGRFPHLEIWKPDGTIAYSRTKELVGHSFSAPDGLLTALGGEMASHYTDLAAEEHASRHFNKKYLEIYVPVREDISGRIIAVAEIHEHPAAIERRLLQIRLQTWLVTGVLTLLLMGSLFGIVHRGTRMIASQQKKLQDNIRAVQEISEQNRIFKDRAQRASSRLAELNARYLRNVGAELHDGAAQLVCLAALKVEHIRFASNARKREETLASLETVLGEALHEIRTVSKGLILPEIEKLPLCQVLALAVAAHERHTGTSVVIDCDRLGPSFPHAVKICAYRFVQEGLNNAFKHAGARGQSVSAKMIDRVLVLSVEDEGCEREVCRSVPETGLGLNGMRDRAESLGGTVMITEKVNGGTKVEMKLCVAGVEKNA
jgi:signal transduction histidine kinase